MRWVVMGALLGLASLGYGTFSLFNGDPVTGTMTVLLGLLLSGCAVIVYGQHRGDPRAAGKYGPWRGPYLVAGELIMALGAAIGVLYIVFTPKSSRSYLDSPFEARIYGFVVVGLCVFGAIWLYVRSRGTRQPGR